MQVDAEFPEKLGVLFEPARYKVLYGGRGGSKSWGIARALLIIGAQRPIRVLCAREFQNSIAESAHALLAQQIELLGLSRLYEVQDKRIIGSNGTEFIFKGLRHNIQSVKSTEGVDVCWVEEGRTVGKSSWDVLIPTIRKEGSEIWISFNPELEADETYQRFIVRPPTGAVVVKIGWEDNPWFPAVLRQEALDLKERDPVAYETVWGGHCKQVLDGAIYADEVLAATKTNRFTRVPVVPGVPVHAFFDLGRADMTAIWFVQVVGYEFRFVGYYEMRGKPFGHYLEQLRARGYHYGDVWLPHDARHETIAAQRTVEQQAREGGFSVRIVPNIGIAEGISAARTIFARCVFDIEACADGLQCLRSYRYDVDEETGQYSRKPLHDWASHGADAFRYVAVGLSDPKPVKRERTARPARRGWMG